MAVKKLVYMSQSQARLLKQVSEAEAVSEAEVMRRALETYGAKRLSDPFEDLIGMCSEGPGDGAQNHDLYLYGDKGHAHGPAEHFRRQSSVPRPLLPIGDRFHRQGVATSHFGFGSA